MKNRTAGGHFDKGGRDRRKGSGDSETQVRHEWAVRVKGGREDTGEEGGREGRRMRRAGQIFDNNKQTQETDSNKDRSIQ